MTDDPAQYAGSDEAAEAGVRPDHGGRRRAARGGRGHRAARRAGPRPGRRPHPSPAADQPGLDPGRDRPRRVGPVPAPVRGGQGHRHRRGGRRADRRPALAPDHADPAGHGRPDGPLEQVRLGPAARRALGQPVPRADPRHHDPRARVRRPGGGGPLVGRRQRQRRPRPDPRHRGPGQVRVHDHDGRPRRVHPRHHPGGRPPAGPRHRGAVRARSRVRRGGAPARLDRRQARVVRGRGAERRVHAGHAPGRDHRVARGAAARRRSSCPRSRRTSRSKSAG